MPISTPTLVTRVFRRGLNIAGRPFAYAARSCFGVIRSVLTDQPAIALTFDDGPNPECTPALFTLLARYNARATFFMVGKLAVRHPEIVRAAAQGGHAIANHSWSHLSLPMLTAREHYEQLRRAEDALSPYCEKLFRPPYCHQSVSNCWHTLLSGYDVVTFSVHAEDWLPRSSEWMAARLVGQARPGSIIILHDNIYRSILPAAQHDRGPMLRALEIALEELQERFRFVTVPELLRSGRAVRENHFEGGLPEMEPALRCILAEQRREEESRTMPPEK